MKIAYVNQPWEISSPPFASGSLGIFSYQVARRFAREREGSVVIYEKPRDGAAAVEAIDGITYVRVGLSFQDRVARGLLRRLDRFRSPHKAHFAAKMFFADYAARVARDLRTRGCDIVHIHNFSQFVPPIRRQNPFIKIVLHMNCDWLAQIDSKMLEPRLAQCDVIMGCSEHVTGAVRRRFPQFTDRCRTVFNGADTEWFAPADRNHDEKRETRMVFVGRVSPEKGVHDLLDAFAIVAKDHPEAQLELLGQVNAAPREYMVDISADPKVRALDRFYGRGADYGAALRHRMNPEVAERTTFTTFLPQQQVAERVRRADVMVLASLTDACPLPVIEAMACGVPVVASRVGGIPELVEDGVTGVLAESRNPAELATAMKKVLADAEMRREMGRRGRERAVRLFAWERIADALRVSYREAMERGPLPADEAGAALKEHVFA